MAIKKRVKSIDEAYAVACKKNNLNIHKRKEPRTTIKVKDDNGDIYVIGEDLIIKRLRRKRRLHHSSPINILEQPVITAYKPVRRFVPIKPLTLRRKKLFPKIYK